MRILVLASCYPRTRGDYAGVFVHELARELVALGEELLCLVPHDTYTASNEVIDGVNVCRFGYFWPKSLHRLCYGGGVLENLRKSILARIQAPLYLTALTFNTLYHARRYDIVHAHWIIPQGIAGLIAKIAYGKRLVVTAHAGDVFPLKSDLLKKMAKIVLERSDAVTVNSRATYEAVKQYVKEDKISIIPMGVCVDEFPNGKPEDVRRKHKLCGKVVLYVGRLSEKKGVIYLVRAFKELTDKHQNVTLLIVGEGPRRKLLESEVESLGLRDKTAFAGEVARDDIASYYLASDVFVLPSIVDSRGDTEGLGVVIIEALSCGLPVVASNTGGITDLVVDGETGLLVPPADIECLFKALDRILLDPTISDKITSNGKNLVKEKYGWKTLAKQFHNIYGKLL